MKTGTFEQMKERKSNLPNEIKETESLNMFILIVPVDIERMKRVLNQFSRKPTDEEVYDLCGDIPYTIRNIFMNGASIGYSEL